MKNIRMFGLFILLVAFLVACGTSGTSSEPTTRFEPYPEETQILALTNAFRAQPQICGTQQFPAAPVVTHVEAVGDTAWYHSRDMATQDTVNHVGASTVDRLIAQGFTPGLTVEHRNKTSLPVNPEDAFNAWTADPVSCANIMNPAFTIMGAGYSGHHEGFLSAYWTQILTTPQTTTVQPTLSLNPTAATVTVGGAAVTINATLANATDTINWVLTGAGTLSGTTGATITYTPPTTGEASTATLTATAGALTAAVAITINAVTPAPTLTLTPTTATTTVADATAIPFTAALTNSADAITWTLTGAGTLSTATGATTNYTAPTTGEAGTATLTATAGTLTASATITINAAAAPGLTVTPTTATSVVNGPDIIIKASSNQITWTMTGPGSFAWAGDTFTFKPGGVGTTVITAIAVTGGQTASATITTVDFKMSPTTASVEIGGAAIPFTATLAGSTEAINWNLTGLGTLSTTTGATTNYTPPTTGEATTATLTATAGALTLTSTITINVAVPRLTLTPTTTTATIGGAAVLFTATLSNSVDPINWTLTGPGSISSTTGATTSFTPPATGTAATSTLTATAGPLTASATITLELSYQEAFLLLINAFRSQPQTCAGQAMPAVAPVSLNANLNISAQRHSQDMADNNYFSHTGQNGSTWSTRNTAAGYTGTSVGENIAAGSETPQNAFDNWRGSTSGHCQFMMSANINEIGIGYGQNVTSQWTHYWTLVGGRK